MSKEFSLLQLLYIIYTLNFTERTSKMDSNSRGVEGGASKRRKLNQKSDVEVAVATVLNRIEQTSEIFKLPIKMFEYVFNYLPLQHLAAAGDTCKLLNEFTGHHFGLNYSNVRGMYNESDNGEINICDRYGQKLHTFIHYISEMSVNGHDYLRIFLDTHSKFHQLRYIQFNGIDFTKIKIEHTIKNMSQVESLVINGCNVKENFLGFFPNIKRLALRGLNNGTTYKNIQSQSASVLTPGHENEWLERKYPQLERFELETTGPAVKLPITTFLELNQNVLIFETNSEFLWENRHSIKAAKVSLNELAISIDSTYIDLKSTFQLLNELHDLGFYKRLNAYFKMLISDRTILDELMQLKSITKIYVDGYCGKRLALSSFNDLREICFQRSIMIANTDTTARNLQNLELIHFHRAKLTHVIPFLRQSKELKKIKIDIFEGGGHFNEATDVISLAALNRERKQLQNAAKVTLYVSESIYSATKSAIRSVDLELINLQHSMSYSWDHAFGLVF